MAFPASSTQADALDTIRKTAVRLKSHALSAKDALAAGNRSANDIIGLMVMFQEAVRTWDGVSSTPGLVAYAREQFDDPALDIAAEFTAMRNAALAVTAWVQNNFPKDASGYLLKEQFDDEIGLAVRSFTPAQTLGLRNTIDAFTATIV
jgi:hypothetical protein